MAVNLDDENVHATMATELPQFVIIQTSQENNRYLHLYKENPVLPNALRFVGDYSFELETRFEVEQATTGTGLIHIRSLQNNKYWANFGTSNNWVSAMADKPEEDQSNRYCTLFQPIFVYSDNNRLLRLRHVNTKSFVMFYHGSGDHFGLLSLLTGDDGGYNDVCTFIDWDSLTMLPNLIRIKGDNGNYLCAYGGDGYMDYNYKADNSSLFDYEVYPSRDGGIRLKSRHYKWYWTAMDNSSWVLLKEASTTVHDTNTVFLPQLVDGNRIVMRCWKKNMLCSRHSDSKKTNCLAAQKSYTDEYSYMVIEEPIVSRKINNVRYHLTDARLYNEKTVALISDETKNSLAGPLTSSFDLKTTVSNTSNWSTSTSFTVGVKMSLTFGVPFIESGSLEISAEGTKSSGWGETTTETIEVGSVKTINVPAMTRVKGNLMETRLSYDIPFSYTQYDVLKDGSTNVSKKNDGLFTGNNGYGYSYEVLLLPFN